MKLSPGGFYELIPQKQIIFDEIIQIISTNYKRYGFFHIETNSVELNSILSCKGEVENQIFKISGTDGQLKNYSLHYDLTVPLARYICENESQITFPFKRYQIQKVWRGERQQTGRYKEFYQADIDIIGKNISSNYTYEVISCLNLTIKDIFKYLNLDLVPTVHINSKLVLDSLCTLLNLKGDEKEKFYLFLDKYYKLSDKDKELGLKQYGLSGVSLESIVNYNLDGVSEIINIIERLKEQGVKAIFDLSIVRGLSYYTDIVFETFIDSKLNFGSICSGGRYGDLISQINGKDNGLEGIGGSIGLTRLFSRLDSEGYIKERKNKNIFVFNLGTEGESYRSLIVNKLRTDGISLDVYYSNETLKKQFDYSQKLNYSYGLFLGENEEKKDIVVLRNLETKEQVGLTYSDLLLILKEYDYS